MNLAEPEMVTSESEQSEDGSEEEQETKRTERCKNPNFGCSINLRWSLVGMIING